MSIRSTRSSSSKSSTLQEPLELSESEIKAILAASQQQKPSSISTSSSTNTNGKTKPLIILSPDELNDIIDNDKEVDWKKKEEEGKEGGRGDEDKIELWEELLTDFFWSMPFGFLYYGMDSAVHAQFGMDLIFDVAMKRLFNILLTVFALTFFLSRPTSSGILPPIAIQFLLLTLCLGTGISLIHITTTESYLKVMKQAPGLGTLWVWSIVRLDLYWAILGLIGVAVAVWFRGESGGVIWW